MPSLSEHELRALANSTAETLQGYLDDAEGWHVAKKTKDLIVEYKHSTCPGFEHGYLYRGQTEYNCPKEIVFKYIDPVDGECLRVKWDKDIKGIKLVKQFDENLRINVSMTNSAAAGLIAPRDFVDLILNIQTDNCISTNGVSIECDDYPVDSKFVRGFNHPCGIMVLALPGKPNCSKLVTFIQPDIKGMLPRSLVDAAIPKSMAGFFNNLRDILHKDGHLK